MKNNNTNDFNTAISLCNAGKYSDALPYFDKVLAVDKKNDEAYRMKGQALMMLGCFKEATDVVIDALNINPQNVWTLILMGNIFAKQNNITEAMHYYDEALKYHPNDVIAFNNIGAAYLQQGLLEKALETFDRALSIDSSYPNTYYGKAVTLSRLGKDNEAWDILLLSGTKALPRKENPQIIEEMNKLKMSVALRLSKGGDGYRAIATTIEELEKTGGMEIKTEAVEKMTLSAKLEYGKIHGRNYHRVIYNSQKDYHEHLVLHELTHLRMIINASKAGKNEVPITDIEQANAFHQRFAYFFNKLSIKLEQDSVKQFEKDMRNGLTLQLYNCPLDLLVEDYIYQKYPEVRPIQLLSLFSQEEDNIKSIQAAEKAKLIPPAIIRASKLMNIVTSMHLEELYGINLLNYYKPTRNEIEVAKDLYDEYKAYGDGYAYGEEYELCRYFIETLGFEDLIVWVNENVAKIEDSLILQAKEAIQEVSPNEINELNKDFSEKHKDGDNPAETMMMAMYMLDAMQRFDKMQHLEVKKVAMEIATIGITGISPEKKNGYTVPSLGNEDFGGYRLLAYYYVSFARELPEILPKLNLPFSKAYESALLMYSNNGK